MVQTTIFIKKHNSLKNKKLTITLFFYFLELKGYLDFYSTYRNVSVNLQSKIQIRLFLVSNKLFVIDHCAIVVPI